jgi:hypothetical protein
MKDRAATEGLPEAFQLSLRVRHPTLDPAEISRALQIDPEHSFRAGASRGTRAGGAAVHTESYWLGVLALPEQILGVTFPGEHAAIAQKQLAAARKSLTWALALRIVRILSPHKELFRRICAEGGTTTLLVTVASDEITSFTLAAEACRVLGDLAIAVEFELLRDE